MSLRVVNLGLPKTGTTTLSRALKIAGFKVADHRIRPRQTDRQDIHNAYVAELIYRGYFRTGDPGAEFPEITAISEMSCMRDGHSLWPQMDFGIIDALRRTHPGVKFVATHRNSWDVSRSMLAWSDLGTSRLPSGAVPGLPPGFGETSKEREIWIDAHYTHLSQIFRNDPDYLELDVANPGVKDRLATHIGADITWWGRANRTPTEEGAI